MRFFFAEVGNNEANEPDNEAIEPDNEEESSTECEGD